MPIRWKSARPDEANAEHRPDRALCPIGGNHPLTPDDRLLGFRPVDDGRRHTVTVLGQSGELLAEAQLGDASRSRRLEKDWLQFVLGTTGTSRRAVRLQSLPSAAVR
jgi:hypothetical protein